MSISSNLTKLTTDITNAYTSINNKGGTIPANKNTNNLSTAIDSIEVIEQATAEGESLSLTNTKAMPYSDYVVEGKSEQETRSGKNLYNVNELSTSGDVSIDNDDWITINIDNSQGSSAAIANFKHNFNNLINVSTNYAVFLEIKNVSGNGFLCINEPRTQSQCVTDLTFNLSSLTSNSINKYIFNTKSNFQETINMLWSYVYTTAGKSCSVTFRISVLSDTTTTTDNFTYEPYGISPSPDYPSDIHSVADDVNLLNVPSDFSLKGFVKIPLNIPANTPFTISLESINLGGEASSLLSFKDNNEQTLGYNVNLNPSLLTDTREFTSDVASVYIYSQDTYNNSKYVTTTYTKLMIKKGTTSTPYSPYNQGTVTIKQRGKNENDGINYGFYIGAEATTYRISGADNGLCIPIENEVYTISSKEIQNRYRIACSNSLPSNTSQNCFNGVVKDGTNDNVTIDTSGYKYLLINCTNINDIQTEQGSTATLYEPYQANDYTIQTEPLRSLPNGVKDTIEADGIHRRVGRVILDGTENWDIYNTIIFLYVENCVQTANTTDIPDFVCNNFIANSYTALSTTQSNNYIGPNTIGNAINQRGFCFRNNANFSTVADCKTWLATHNTEVLYPLATEVIEPLTQNQATTMLDIIKTGSYEGTTNIYTDEDVKPTIGVGYYKKD